VLGFVATTVQSRSIVIATALAAALACSVDRPPAADRAFADGWAFPASRVEASDGAEGMASTTDRVASEIGAEVLRRRGNAIDAAVAVHFARAVVNPEAGNIGGGGFMVVRMADGRTAALDVREKAPRAATRDMYVDSPAPADSSLVGHKAAGVPGSVAGLWDAHQRFGSRPWRELPDPAIHLADGIVVHERLAESRSLAWLIRAAGGAAVGLRRPQQTVQ
jgi:gamma-glutamyltranspeptidase/glutathione hydrolase